MDFEGDEGFCCPISLVKFTYPLVLDCGHTIDKISFDKIPNKKICPVCNSPNTSINRINWTLVSLMKLNIPSKAKQPPKKITASEAAALLSAQIKETSNHIFENEVMEKIYTQIYDCKSQLIFDVKDSRIRNELIEILQNKYQYKVEYKSDQLTIRW